MDVTLLVMRIDGRSDIAGAARWFQGDIVDMWRGTGRDPGPGTRIHSKHAVIVVRDINMPSTGEAYTRLENFLTQENIDDDQDATSNRRNRRRHQLVIADLAPQQRNSIRNDGRLVMQAADFPPLIRRKVHGANLERRLVLADMTDG